MPSISLRSYNTEIESLIDRGLINEAIAHCRQILSFYPKCIATYKVLAKAYLENKNYTEASDIFSRVLSVYPDDFISHIGMSIIKEDEGNLDAAIWHMELAFDLQPSNLAVQEELRRLFGRRDGIQPGKIKLTRGALIRMYARGELYQQAIAEILSALEEDPKRVDLEVILAQMYYQSGSFVEATEVCNWLLNKLPYIFEANRILSNVLLNTAQADNARFYKDRLIALDPYYGLVSSPDESVDTIADDNIQIEKLTVDNSETTSYPQGWSHSLNHEWDIQSKEPVPEWLSNMQEPSDSQEPVSDHDENLSPSGFTSPESKPASTPNISSESSSAEPFTSDHSEELPDWMRNAGWMPSSGEVISEIPMEDGHENESDSNTPQPADIPDWLRNLEPENEQDNNSHEKENELISNDSTESLPESIQESLSPKIDSTESQLLAGDILDLHTETNSPSEEQASIPLEEVGENMASDNLNPENNEWLNQFRSDSSQPGDTTPEDDHDLPEWLKNFEEEQETPSRQEDDLPDWLHSLQTPSSSQSLSSDSQQDEDKSLDFPLPAVPISDDENLDAILNNQNQLFTKMLTPNEKPSAENQTAYLQPESHPLPVDWEKEIVQAEESVTEEPEKSTSPEIPEWVRNALKLTGTSANIIEEENKSPAESSNVIPEVSPIFAESTESKNNEINASEEQVGAISEETNNELLDWLRTINTDEASETSSTEISETEPEGAQAQESEFNYLDRLTGLESPESISNEQQPVADAASAEPEETVISFVRQPEEETSDFFTTDQESTVEPKVFVEPPVNIQETTEDSEVVTPLHELEPEIARTSPDPLESVETLLQNGQIDEAADQYNSLLKDHYDLSLIETSVRSNIDRNPDQPELWQLLGDVLARFDRLDDALHAYEKAESLLLQKYNF